jgi:hypothetical protein
VSTAWPTLTLTGSGFMLTSNVISILGYIAVTKQNNM